MNRTVLVGLLVAVGFVALACAGGCSTAPPAPMIGQVDSYSGGAPMKATNWRQPGEDPRLPDGHYKYGRYPNWR